MAIGTSAIGTQPIGTRREYSPELIANELNQDNRLETGTITENYILTGDGLRQTNRLEIGSIANQDHNVNGNDLRQENRLSRGLYLVALDDTQSPPSQNKISQSTFGLNNVIGRSESSFTLSEKTFDYGGQRWQGEFQLVDLYHDEMAEWKAWLAVTEGKFRQFYFDPPHQSPRGNVSQNGTVDSISRPRQLTIAGLDANTDNIFREGDYIELKDTDQLMMVTSNADSDGNGKVTVDVEPRIRNAPSTNSTVETQEPQGLFQLATNEPGWTEQGVFSNVKFRFVEVVKT
jgi:hypothetical protein